eukprot:Plantae.Rhodophyta-Palmaria_palmata.ctg10058.p1 GENE.Plantae.Rhodophyta-Palmaria_palmata.ctg10058~~Plantae.Rhodophyta-Palmaria_palmata.ctg10058.p1  ORF type:complete len:360 (+),score=28.53 Plantae.Rhodophyta-Palmaria_palmata.ctg10058:129-1082(+)
MREGRRDAKFSDEPQSLKQRVPNLLRASNSFKDFRRYHRGNAHDFELEVDSMTWEEGAEPPSKSKSFTLGHRAAADRQLSDNVPPKNRMPTTASDIWPSVTETKSEMAPTAPETLSAAPETVLPTRGHLFERRALANRVNMLHLASRDADGDEERDPISVASMSIFDTPTSMVSVQLHSVRGTDFARPFDANMSPPCSPREVPTPSGPGLGSDSAFLDVYAKGGGIFGAFRRHDDELESTKKQRRLQGLADDSSPAAPFRGSPNRAMRKTGRAFSIFTKSQEKEARPDLVRDETAPHTRELLPGRNAMRTNEENAIG